MKSAPHDEVGGFPAIIVGFDIGIRAPMSINIRSGVMFTDPSVDALMAEAPAWRARIKALTAIAKARWFANRAIQHLDARHLGEPGDESQSPLAQAWSEYQADVANEAKGLRHPETDFEFLLTLMPFEGRLYGIVRTERHQWLAEYVSSPGICEFDYWDDTDRPAEITGTDWSERRRIWLGARQLRPGLSLDYSSEPGVPSEEEILAALPSFEYRLDRAARDRTRDYYVRDVANVRDGAGMTELISAANRANEWIQSPLGQIEFARERDRISAILPKDVTVEMLKG